MRGRVVYSIRDGIAKKKHLISKVFLPVLSMSLLAGLVVAIQPARAASVNPNFLSGASNNGKSCAELDDTYGGGQTWLEFKVQNDSPQPGDVLGNGTFTSGTLQVVISNYSTTSFNWSSNFGIDAIVVKSGSNGSNLYIYQPSGGESTGDTSLGPPSTQEISHISFCYDTQIQQDDPEPTYLTLVKELITNNGGTAAATDWTLSADGPTPISGASGNTEVTDAEVEPGTYTLSESGGPDGYAAGIYNCSKNEGDPVESNSITLEAGDFATCIITNDDEPGTLIVKKVVINDNGGNAGPDDFTFQVNGGEPGPFEADGQKDIAVDAGTYTVTETAAAGYDTTYENCDQVTVTNGGAATCTVTNDDIAPTVTLVKEVINDNGGTAGENDFGLEVGGSSVNSGDTTTVDANTPIVLSEDGLVDYSFVSISGDRQCPVDNGGTVTLNEGENITCTITNDDDPAHLTLVKTVTNDNGGTAQEADWTLSADGPTPISGTTGTANVTNATVSAGTYTLSESGPGGYTAGDWACIKNDEQQISAPEVTLGLSDDVVCTIDNNDDAPPVVLGENTGGQGEDPGPQVLGETLSNTGAGVWLTSLIGGLLLSSTLALFAYSRSTQRKK